MNEKFLTNVFTLCTGTRSCCGGKTQKNEKQLFEVWSSSTKRKPNCQTVGRGGSGKVEMIGTTHGVYALGHTPVTACTTSVVNFYTSVVNFYTSVVNLWCVTPARTRWSEATSCCFAVGPSIVLRFGCCDCL